MTSEGISIPSLTAAQMAEVDRIMMGEFGLDVLQVMEIAGRAVASFARTQFLGGNPRGKRVVVLCGSGGNGGDGMVAARYLHTWGADVEIWLGSTPDPTRGVAAHQLEILRRIGLPIYEPTEALELLGADLVIDALLGFSLSGAPAGQVAALIRAANAQPAPVLAVDLPSGLDATSGRALEPCIRASATLTLALPKTGLLEPGATGFVGALFVADIGVPPEVYRRLGLDIPPRFSTGDVLPLFP